jgi:hypothetical protein
MVNLKYALEHRPEMPIRWPSYGYCGGGCTIVTLSSIFSTTSNLVGSLASDLGGVEQSIAAIATESRRTEEGFNVKIDYACTHAKIVCPTSQPFPTDQTEIRDFANIFDPDLGI